MEKKGKRRGVVLAAGMVIQFCAGIIYMWSVFRAPVAEYLSWDLGQAALTASVMLAMFVAGIVVGGKLQDKVGPRKVVLIGSVMISAGMMLTSLVTPGAPWLVYVTYGVVAGLGVGAVYTATVSAIQKWYPDKRGFATGMMVSSFGVSLVAFAPLVKSMLIWSGVPGTFMILGLAFLVVCVLCSLPITNPPADYVVPGLIKAGGAPTQRQYSTSEMLKTKQFYLIALSMLFLLPAYFILNPLLITLGVDRGLSENAALLGVMITGIASAAGRLIFAWVSDLIGRKGAIMSVILITLAAVLVLIAAEGVLFLVCIAAIAFAFGGSAGVYPAIAADHYGTKHMGLNYGCVMVAFGTSALVFPALSNVLAVGGNYTGSFIVSAITCVISLVLVLFIKKPQAAGDAA